MRKVIVNIRIVARRIRLKRSSFKRRLKDDLLKIKQGLAQESTETKEMLHIYKQYTKGQANKEQMRIANKQFADLIKGMGMGVLVILPFAPITIPLIVALGNKLGINVLPSAFSKPEQTDNLKTALTSDPNEQRIKEDKDNSPL